MSLLAHLPKGRALATSIPALAALAGMSERKVRAELRRLALEDHVAVVTLPCTNGVYLAESPADLLPAKAHLRSKLVSLRERMDALEAIEREMKWSPTLFEMERSA